MSQYPDRDELPILFKEYLPERPRRIPNGIAIESIGCSSQPVNTGVIGVKLQGIEVVRFDAKEQQRLSAA